MEGSMKITRLRIAKGYGKETQEFVTGTAIIANGKLYR